MIGIKYIGSREEHHDNLYGTNLTWTPDQVHNVEDEVAKKLLTHADVYEEANPVKGGAPAVVKAEEKDANEKLPVPLPHLEGMNREELEQFAQQHYGEKFHHKTGEAAMRTKIMTLIQSRGR